MFTDLNSEIFAWVRGGFFILSIYHLILYFQNGKRLYLYYCLYLLSFFGLFASQRLPIQVYEILFGVVTIPLCFLSTSMFCLFTRVVLETKTRLPKWDKILEIGAIALLGMGVMMALIQLTMGSEFQLSMIKFLGPVILIYVAVVSIVMLQTKLQSAKYFCVGTLIYIILVSFTLLSFYIGLDIFFKLGVAPSLFMYIGALIQAFIFAFIIGMSVKRVEMQNKSAEVKLAFKYKELEELKMTALQSQMNPHFLFNSLNSINNFVLKSEVEKASDYITKFSRLIRVILKSSTSLTVPFSEELGILSLYVKLEQMRINGGFKYIVNIDKSIQLDRIKVPPLFLQPFIENSIWHGLTHVEGNKQISLTIKKDNEKIICEIVDNGIGIDTARKQAHKKIDRRKFFGTKATENRIQLLYKKSNVDIEVKDISTQTATGTKVRITFPYELDN